MFPRYRYQINTGLIEWVGKKPSVIFNFVKVSLVGVFLCCNYLGEFPSEASWILTVMERGIF